LVVCIIYSLGLFQRKTLAFAKEIKVIMNFCHFYLHPDPFEIQLINTIIRDLIDDSLKNLGYILSNFEEQ